MVRRPRRRSLRVAGVPKAVLAWIDYDRHPEVLLINGDVFTEQDEEAITAALAGAKYTTRQVLEALIAGG
ncbi:hypothetical protein [Embleya sp. NPDC001921]